MWAKLTATSTSPIPFGYGQENPMRQLIVNLPDAQMRALEKVARSKDMRPENLVSEQLASLTASPAGRVVISIKRYAKYSPSSKQHAYSASSLSKPRQPVIAYRVGTRLPVGDHIVDDVLQKSRAARLEQDAERNRRREVLRQTAGMWKDRRDSMKDGLQYQLEARAEWD